MKIAALGSRGSLGVFLSQIHIRGMEEKRPAA
jgi:hypothetical protein